MWTTSGDGTGTLLFYAGEVDSAGGLADGDRTTAGYGGWSGIASVS
ncbi:MULTISPECIES: hypothetical protein [unclassified Streptomyces]|nr:MULTISPECIES: hypothetical protein [unclassified Streptomyces]